MQCTVGSAICGHTSFLCDLPNQWQTELLRLNRMQTNLFFTLILFSVLLLEASLPLCQLYSQQEKDSQNSAAASTSDIQPKMIKIRVQASTTISMPCCRIRKAICGSLQLEKESTGYNGKSFVQYTQKDGLNSNTVYAMIEDSSGTIWFGTDKGARHYDGKSIDSIPFTFDSKARSSLIGTGFGDSLRSGQ